MNNENNEINDIVNNGGSVEANKGARTNNNIMARKTLNASISEDLYAKFKKHCEDECRTPSKVVERLIEEYLKRGGKR